MPAARSPVPQPLQVTVGGSLEAVEEEHQSAALIGLSLQLAPELRGALQPAGGFSVVCVCVSDLSCLQPH